MQEQQAPYKIEPGNLRNETVELQFFLDDSDPGTDRVHCMAFKNSKRIAHVIVPKESDIAAAEEKAISAVISATDFVK